MSGQVAVAVGFFTRDPSLIWNTAASQMRPLLEHLEPGSNDITSLVKQEGDAGRRCSLEIVATTHDRPKAKEAEYSNLTLDKLFTNVLPTCDTAASVHPSMLTIKNFSK